MTGPQALMSVVHDDDDNDDSDEDDDYDKHILMYVTPAIAHTNYPLALNTGKAPRLCIKYVQQKI